MTTATTAHIVPQVKKTRERVTTKRPTTKKARNNKKPPSSGKANTGILGVIANMFGNIFGWCMLSAKKYLKSASHTVFKELKRF